MSYINFKEEKKKAEIQLNKRKQNNQKLTTTIKNDKSKINMVYEERYSFKSFKDRTFNTSKVKNENEFLVVEYKNIICSDFLECKFGNIHFKNCNFIGCSINKCDFIGGGVIFENCSFYIKEIYNTPSLNIQDNLSCYIQESNLYVKFLNCDMQYLIFENCNIKNTNIELSDMTSLIIIYSDIKTMSLVDNNMASTKIVSTYVEDLEFNDKYKTRLDEKTFFDLIPNKYNKKEEYEGIYKIYESYADVFKNNNLNNNFGEYYYQCRVSQRKSLKIIPKINSYIYWATCGYGERIINAIITSFIIILLFTVLYLLFGYKSDGEVIRYITGQSLPKSFLEFIKQFNSSITLSIGMFAALGADLSEPIVQTYFLANIEVVLGIIMTGIGIGALTRKIVR